MKIIRAFFALLLVLLPAVSNAQPVGQLPSGTFWGNSSAVRAPASPDTITAQINRAITGGSTQGAVLTRNGSAWIGLAPGTAGLPLLSGGAAANLAYGIPALAAGGTGANLTASNGGIFYSTGSVAAILAGTSTARQMLQSGSSATPAWSTTTWPATSTINQILYSSTANVISGLATANSGVLITSSGGVPSIATTLPSGLTLPAPSITSLTVKASPVAADLVIIQDSAASFATKSATVSAIASAVGVSSIGGLSGVVGLGNGLQASGSNIQTSNRECDVRYKGAVGNGVTDDSAAFASCVTDLLALGGGKMNVQPGNYCLFTGVTVSGGAAGSIRIVGASTYSTYLNACGHDVNVVFLNGFYATLENIGVYGKGIFDTTFGASQSAILLGSGCGSCKLSYVVGQGGKYAIEFNSSVEPRLENSAFGYAYGGAIAYLVGAPGAKFHSSSFDQSFPVSTPTPNTLTITTWAAATAYALGAVVNNGGYIMQCSKAGTSGGAAPALKNYNNTITDGTAEWLFAGANGYAAIQLDSNSSEFLGEKLDISGSYTYGINLTNNFGSPTRLIHLFQSVIGGATTNLIHADAGSDIFLIGNEIFGCLNVGCSGIQFSGTWTGEGTISDNKLGQAGYAINLSAGGNMVISNNRIDTTLYGVFVAANMTDFIVAGNKFGTANTNTIVVTAGTSNYYNITNNIVRGVAVSDGGAGVNKTVSGNN